LIKKASSVRVRLASITNIPVALRYDGGVRNARTCVVSFMDSAGIRHSIEVAAESLYEAVALAVHEFRRHPWADGMEPGAVTRLSVSVNAPQTAHELSIRQLEKWVSGTTRSPKDTVLKARVRELLKMNAGG
jgi:hypothetical protein